MKLVDSKPQEAQYNLFYRSSRVFRTAGQWYFEDENGKPFGPFDSKDQTMKAVRIYRDVRQRGVDLSIDRIRRVL
jgi:hypothetical protein